MRTCQEIQALLCVDQVTAQAFLRARDAFMFSYACSQEQYNAVEDYLLGITLALGRDTEGVWLFSPVMYYQMLTACLVMQELGDKIRELAGLLAPLPGDAT